MEYYYKIKMTEIVLDFILGEQSPLFQDGDFRSNMGGNFAQPDFTFAL